MMNIWYDIVDMLLPFQWLNHDFMKNALLAILIISPVFGILGTMIVNNKMAFFSDALGHGSFTGIAIGSILGLMNPIGSAVIFSLFFALLMTWIKEKSKSSADTVIGVFSSTAIALGVVLISVNGTGKYMSYLFGDILSITSSDIAMLWIVLVLVLVLWLFLFNKMLLISINRSLAASRGANTLRIDMIFTAMIAVIITVAINWVGLLVINSLLVLPAATARNVTANVKRYHVVSVAIALISGILGLILSYYFDTATGATIVLICSFFFFSTFFIRNKV